MGDGDEARGRGVPARDLAGMFVLKTDLLMVARRLSVACL
jgi:hypothetical protein